MNRILGKTVAAVFFMVLGLPAFSADIYREFLEAESFTGIDETIWQTQSPGSAQAVQCSGKTVVADRDTEPGRLSVKLSRVLDLGSRVKVFVRARYGTDNTRNSLLIRLGGTESEFKWVNCSHGLTMLWSPGIDMFLPVEGDTLEIRAVEVNGPMEIDCLYITSDLSEISPPPLPPAGRSFSVSQIEEHYKAYESERDLRKNMTFYLP
ncbi:MAG: hypothetical protein JXN60_05500, partial [Lentisphaerae bacterium]|nr:hypothetical protein [Lentisphaerota bacterium]